MGLSFQWWMGLGTGFCFGIAAMCFIALLIRKK